jgi:hypothetical protein
MGIYYEATTAIGYKISTNGFYEEIKKPSCNHNPLKNEIFCHTCGLQVRIITERKWKDEADYFDAFVNEKLPKGYAYNTLYDHSGDVCWIGYGSTVSNDGGKMKTLKPYKEIKDEIQAMLKPFIDTNLFVLDDKEFGIWTIYTGH